MSYQLLLGCRGQTAKCHQIANQLIQISLHWAKSPLIPLKIPSVFPHRSTCSSVCVYARSHVGIKDREKGNSSCWWTMIVLQRATFTISSPSFSPFSCLVRSYLPSSPFPSPLSSPGSSSISVGWRISTLLWSLIDKASASPSHSVYLSLSLYVCVIPCLLPLLSAHMHVLFL